MCLAQDQHPVGHLSAPGASEAFANRVHAGSLDGGSQDPDTGSCEDGVEWCGEVRSRSRIRNLLRHEVARCE